MGKNRKKFAILFSVMALTALLVVELYIMINDSQSYINGCRSGDHAGARISSCEYNPAAERGTSEKNGRNFMRRFLNRRRHPICCYGSILRK